MPRIRPSTLQANHRALGAAAVAWKEAHPPGLKGYAFRHGVGHLLASHQPQRAEALLTDFAYGMARLESLGGNGAQPLANDVEAVHAAEGLADPGIFCQWEEFYRIQTHLLARGDEDWGADKILLQLLVRT